MGHKVGMMGEKAAVKVSVESWKRLNSMKEPGDTFEDVVCRLLDERDEMSGPTQ